MSVSRKIHINALPEPVRRRLTAGISGNGRPGPLHAVPLSSGVVGFGFLALLGLATIGFACWYGFGLLHEDAALQSPEWLVAYAAGGFTMVYAILSLMRRTALHRALPFAPGRYLFALDFMKAHGEVLELWPMTKCYDFRGTHHHTNGVYTHTTFSFYFEGGHTESFTIRGKSEAEHVLHELGAIQRTVSDAAARLGQGQAKDEDLAVIVAFDPFFEARMSDEWASLSAKPPHNPGRDAVAKPLPGYLGHAALIALVTSALLGTPTWYVRNLLSDDAMWAQVQASSDSRLVQQYLYRGGRRVEEARALLMEREFREAMAQGTVTALRSFLDKYPNHEGAKSAVHALYMQAVAAFADQASTADPRLVPFVKTLVANLESTESTRVDVRFSRPSAALLEEIDEHASKNVHLPVAPVAPHFSEATAEARERAILAGLQQGFGAVFPQDILTLAYVPPSGQETTSESSRPTIDLAYVIAPSGSLYRGEQSVRSFIGIQVHFAVEMRVPGYADVISFELDVQPPSTFTVESSYMAFAGVPVAEQMPSDDLVYRVMAARAFDHLSQKLRDALFRNDSEAFRRAANALQGAGAGIP